MDLLSRSANLMSVGASGGSVKIGKKRLSDCGQGELQWNNTLDNQLNVRIVTSVRVGRQTSVQATVATIGLANEKLWFDTVRHYGLDHIVAGILVGDKGCLIFEPRYGYGPVARRNSISSRLVCTTIINSYLSPIAVHLMRASSPRWTVSVRNLVSKYAATGMGKGGQG